jgi:hypothetical protein
VQTYQLSWWDHEAERATLSVRRMTGMKSLSVLVLKYKCLESEKREKFSVISSNVFRHSLVCYNDHCSWSTICWNRMAAPAAARLARATAGDCATAEPASLTNSLSASTACATHNPCTAVLKSFLTKTK